MLYTWSQHKIILNVNCNWKIKLRKKSRLKFYNLFSNSYMNAVNFLLLMMVRESCHHTPWMITRNCSFWNWWSLQYLLSHIFCFFPLKLFFSLFLPPVHHTPTWNIFWHPHMNSCLIYILWLKVSLSPQLGPSEQRFCFTLPHATHVDPSGPCLW